MTLRNVAFSKNQARRTNGGNPMQEIECGLRGEVGVSDQERLEEIKHMYGLIEAEQFTIKTADYEQLYAAAEKSIEMEKYVLGTSRKLDGLHEYLQKNHSGKGWGKHIIDAAIQVMEEQQKEIERLQSQLYTEPMNRTLTLHEEEWEYILAACEQMSCGYERTEYLTHCCDLNEVVPKLREALKE